MPAPEPPSGRRTWTRLLPLGVAVLLLGAIFATVNWPRLWATLRQADAGLLGTAFLCQWGAMLLQGWRWGVLLGGDGRPRALAWVQLLHLKATFFDVFTPGRVGSDLYRLAVFPAAERHHVAASLLAMRIQGLAANLMVLGMGALLAGGEGRVGHPLVVLTALAGLVGLGLLLWLARRLGERGVARLARSDGGRAARLASHGRRLLAALAELADHPRVLLVSWFIALLFVVWSCWVFRLVGEAMGLHLPLAAWLVGVSAIMVAIVLPITVHGRGLSEAAALFFWSGSGATTEQILLVSLGIYAIHLLQSLLAGLLVLPTGAPNRHRESESPAENGSSR
ncbi:MAG: flippase-like domain-containing protein [Magnetococcales bacterium]|nr:flippase-like domain-containing protein [Magnetococcales bacterium]